MGPCRTGRRGIPVPLDVAAPLGSKPMTKSNTELISMFLHAPVCVLDVLLIKAAVVRMRDACGTADRV